MFTMVKTKRLYEKEMKHRFHLQCQQILLLSLTTGYQNVFQSDIDYYLKNEIMNFIDKRKNRNEIYIIVLLKKF